jgi:hypothetical protein
LPTPAALLPETGLSGPYKPPLHARPTCNPGIAPVRLSGDRVNGPLNPQAPAALSHAVWRTRRRRLSAIILWVSFRNPLP